MDITNNVFENNITMENDFFFKMFSCRHSMKRTHQLCTKSDKKQDTIKDFASLLEEVHVNHGVMLSLPSRF